MQKLEKALWIKDSKMSREVTKMFCYSYALWDKCFYPNFIRTFTSPLFLSPIHFALHKIWEKGQRFQIKSMRAEENVIWRFSSLTRYGQRWSDARLNIANIGGGHLVRVTHHTSHRHMSGEVSQVFPPLPSHPQSQISRERVKGHC